jgi:hypothetical protein
MFDTTAGQNAGRLRYASDWPVTRGLDPAMT